MIKSIMKYIARVVVGFCLLGVDRSDGLQRTPLHTAVEANDYGAVRRLIDSGENLDARNSWEETPLYKASMNGDLKMVEILLRGGADPNAISGGQWSPLQAAATQPGRADIVEFLLENGANPDLAYDDSATPLQCALQSHGDLEIIKILMGYNADVNATAFDERTTPLCEAIFSGSTEAVDLLLSCGANPNLRCVPGWSPLRELMDRVIYTDNAGTETTNILKLLLAYGADPTCRDRDGLTPLLYLGYSIETAQRRNGVLCDEVIGILLANGAEVDATDTNRRTFRDCVKSYPRLEKIVAEVTDKPAANAFKVKRKNPMPDTKIALVVARTICVDARTKEVLADPDATTALGGLVLEILKWIFISQPLSDIQEWMEDIGMDVRCQDKVEARNRILDGWSFDPNTEEPTADFNPAFVWVNIKANAIYKEILVILNILSSVWARNIQAWETAAARMEEVAEDGVNTVKMRDGENADSLAPVLDQIYSAHKALWEDIGWLGRCCIFCCGDCGGYMRDPLAFRVIRYWGTISPGDRFFLREFFNLLNAKDRYESIYAPARSERAFGIPLSPP